MRYTMRNLVRDLYEVLRSNLISVMRSRSREEFNRYGDVIAHEELNLNFQNLM